MMDSSTIKGSKGKKKTVFKVEGDRLCYSREVSNMQISNFSHKARQSNVGEEPLQFQRKESPYGNVQLM